MYSSEVYPARHQPKFTLSPDDSVFCIGSCFARNVEEHLIVQGVSVPSRRIISPRSEFGGRPNGLVNKYTTASMLNELNWLVEEPRLDETFFCPTTDGLWLDLQLSSGVRPVTLERAQERRRYLRADYFARITQASVVVITLGMIETWHDAESGLHLNVAPTRTQISRNPGRYSLQVTDFMENLTALQRFCNILVEANPSVRIILTVSPVPLDISFQGTDPGVANMLSKAVLRAVAETVALSRQYADYFPSFEMISLAPRLVAYGPDMRHVRDLAVRRVVQTFIQLYMGQDVATEDLEFNEIGYLEANPDVDEAIRTGVWESGYEHWRQVGRADGRPLLPPDGVTHWMKKAGAI